MYPEEEVRQEDPEWFFFSGGPGAPRYGDDPTKHAVDHDTETFVREVLQNANDQGLEGSEPVKVTFRFLALEGEERSEFLEALKWEEGLRRRITSVAETTRGRGYTDALGRIEDPEEPLRLLIVEDRNTTGLTGSWDQDSNYAALVRDELYSSKRGDDAGGSYGLGKSVLWTFSGTSTVCFNSQPAADDGAAGQRLIARTKLPTHDLEYEDVDYQGAGWLCRPTKTDRGVRPGAISGDRAVALANRLGVDRPEASGTSAMVVDYRDPTRDGRVPIPELAEEFLYAAVKYFWPAISRGDLEVAVETPDGTVAADVRAFPEIRPFVECFEERAREGTSLDTPGDVAGLDVPVELPPEADGSETPTGPVRLLTRLASPADDESLRNTVAMFRGAGMVVKYLDQSRVAHGDRTFHGVLACGEARHPTETTPADRAVERFLRFAEPPEHDDWLSTENLRQQYQRGFRTALDDMFDTVRDALRHLTARSEGVGETLSDRVRKRFPIHGGRARPPSRNGSAEPAFDIESHTHFSDGRWQFETTLSPTSPTSTAWSVEVSMTGVGEDGTRHGEIPVETVRCDPEPEREVLRGGTAVLEFGANAGTAEITGKTEILGDEWSDSPRVGETRLLVEATVQNEGEG